MFKRIRKFGTNVSKNMKNLYIIDPRRIGTNVSTKMEINPTFDEADRKILRALTADSRMSLRDISGYTGLALGTVREHLTKIHDSGIIKGYTTIINPMKVGYKMTAIIEVFENKKTPNLVEKSIIDMPNVCGVYNVTGDTDVLIVARFHDSDELNAFVKRLLRMKNVERTETLIVLDTFKEDFRTVV
jgi:DNA-binding Lrp family transcriptional regulator